MGTEAVNDGTSVNDGASVNDGKANWRKVTLPNLGTNLTKIYNVDNSSQILGFEVLVTRTCQNALQYSRNDSHNA